MTTDNPVPPQRRRVIIDTDPGVDDALALLLALHSPHLDVIAITLSFGNVSLRDTVRNTTALLGLIQRHRFSARLTPLSRPILAIGAAKPLDREPRFAEYIHASDGFGGVFARQTDLAPPHWEALVGEAVRSDTQAPSPETLPYILSTRSAHEEIIHLAHTHPDDAISFVSLGPMTNLALAIQKDPEATARLAHVIAMGGALHIPGNVTPFAEFNIWSDALAAAVCARATTHSDHPLRRLSLIPLDVTSTVNIAPSHLNTLTPTSITAFIDDLLAFTFVFANGLGRPDTPLHDATAIQYLIDTITHANPEDLGWVGSILDLRVESAGEWTAGMLLIDRRPGATAIEENDDPTLQATWGPSGRTRVHFLSAVKGAPCMERILAGINLSSV